jgi:hypothetical protein
MVFNAILFLDCFHKYIKAKMGMVGNIAPGPMSNGTGTGTGEYVRVVELMSTTPENGSTSPTGDKTEP